MQLKVGEIVEGTVKSLTKFGAFVALDATTTGLVHISEVAHAYVSDIHDYLTEGQTVKVKIIAIDENGRINLSIKKALPQEPPRPAYAQPFSAPRAPMPAEESFEDKLKNFMADSNSRMSDLKHQNDRKSGYRRPRQK